MTVSERLVTMETISSLYQSSLLALVSIPSQEEGLVFWAAFPVPREWDMLHEEFVNWKGSGRVLAGLYPILSLGGKLHNTLSRGVWGHDPWDFRCSERDWWSSYFFCGMPGKREGVLVVEGESISNRALTLILFLLSTGGWAPCSLLRCWVCYRHSCTVCDNIVTCHRILCKYWTGDFNPPSLPPSL